MVKLTEVARRLRGDQTEAEKLLWSKLRDRRFMGLKFRRQVTIESYVADFVCFERGVIVELDGGQHVDCVKDKERSDVLESKGFLVKRYWNNDVMGNLEGVLVDLQETLDTLTPALSLQGEGEEREVV
jgi:very-short-patch-repair endonuclease